MTSISLDGRPQMHQPPSSFKLESEESLDSNRSVVSGDDDTRSRSSTTSAFLNLINNGSVSGFPKPDRSQGRLFSLFRLLLLELNLPGPGSSKHRSPTDDEEEVRAYESIVNMAKIPVHLEKFMLFGLLVCFNSFLTLFTLVPLKIFIIAYRVLTELTNLKGRQLTEIASKFRFVKRDLVTSVLIVISVYILGSPSLEISRLYHDIRGQAQIKSYVMFGVLEVTDKLLSSLGQDILTVLLGIPITDASPRNMTKLFLFFSLALFYSCCHSYVLIYQTVSLHVAANSYSNALLTLLLSNQFAELKSAVFKKFEREGLFQLTMSDLTERFQLTIMLSVIALRNISQLGSTQLGLLPDSWNSWNQWIGAIFGPTLVVLGSEILVDWVKHCFINKFNRIRPRIYENFLYVLSQDFMEVFSANSKTLTSHEISDYVNLTKRIGLPVMSLCICFLSMTSRDLSAIFLPSSFSIGGILASLALICLAFVAALVSRLTLSLWLLNWARRIKRNRDAYQTELKGQKGKMSPILEIRSPFDEAFSLKKDFQEPQVPHSPLSAGSSEISLHTLPQLPILDTAFSSSFDEDRNLENSPDFGMKRRSLLESEDEIASSFLPGIPNTESSSINPKTRSYLYDLGEMIPPTPEEKRNAQVTQRRINSPMTPNENLDETLSNVQRYEMSSKRIW